ncbi:hypothetical protein B0T11DRAFT_315252 [Plectosphaerella cucumerina]|uniref:BZIP domain-containing protein n=1 Tax=Plectosphaerella cucumerina TaxID=40658 RepID=A0A8K0TUM0_9PEZI|nr:hypothetical protein B0T11DRAFT_315252 [Plectosphaerella cucumerina]
MAVLSRSSASAPVETAEARRRRQNRVNQRNSRQRKRMRQAALSLAAEASGGYEQQYHPETAVPVADQVFAAAPYPPKTASPAVGTGDSIANPLAPPDSAMEHQEHSEPPPSSAKPADSNGCHSTPSPSSPGPRSETMRAESPDTAPALTGTVENALHIIESAYGCRIHVACHCRWSRTVATPFLFKFRPSSVRVLFLTHYDDHTILATWVGHEPIVVYDLMPSSASLSKASAAIFGTESPPEDSPPITVKAPFLARDSEECTILLAAVMFHVAAGRPVSNDLDAASWGHVLSALCEPLSPCEYEHVSSMLVTLDSAPQHGRTARVRSLGRLLVLPAVECGVDASNRAPHQTVLSTISSADTLFRHIGEAALQRLRVLAAGPGVSRPHDQLWAAAEAWAVTGRLRVFCAALIRHSEVAAMFGGN